MSACSQCYSQYIHCYNGCSYNGRPISPLPVIGTTVAVASLVCSLLIAADILRSFRERQPWIRCKFFTLSAASLAPLTIAMKLLMDLTNPTPNAIDQLAKLSSTAFLCTSMASVMPSIGSLSNLEIVYDVVGLAILVMPTVLNVLIQVFMGMVIGLVVEHVVLLFLLLFTLAAVIFTAVSVPSVRRDVDRKFGEIQRGDIGFDGLEDYVEERWMIAQTGSLDFVIVRLATSSAAAAASLVVLVVMVEAVIRMLAVYPNLDGYTEYRWATYLILVTQTGGVIIGAVGAAFRLFVTYSYPARCRLGNGTHVEWYWTRNLEKCRRTVLHPKFEKRRGRKALGIILSVLVRLQILVVKASKCVRIVSMFLLDGLYGCYYFCKKSPGDESNQLDEIEMGPCKGMEFRHCVILLEGEEELPGRVIEDIRKTARDLVDEGRGRKPKHLLDFLSKGTGRETLPSLDFQESVKCWSLPVVTLASICTALSDAGNPNVNSLIRSVREGLRLTRLIEKHIDREREFLDRRNAAEVTWTGVEFHGKWLDQDLNLRGKTCRERLRWLVDIAETSLKDEGNVNNPDRAGRVEVAYSLEKIGKALLRDNTEWTNGELFDRLSVAIAKLLCASLENLPGAVAAMCTSRREKNVAAAAGLVGEAEDVVKVVQQYLDAK